MTYKTLQQIQEENRKLIILANNQEAKSYEEALEMEVYSSKNIYNPSLFDCRKDFDSDPILLGKPLTLDRILRSLPNYNLFNIITSKNCCKISVLIGINKDKDPKEAPEEEISIYKEMIWDLTKPTLEQQSEETQRAINKLLTQ